MERAYAPLVRQFSPIKGYQTGYTLVYSLDAAAEGSCQLTLARQGAQEQRVSMLVPLDPEKGYRLLQYLYGCCSISMKMPCSRSIGTM